MIASDDLTPIIGASAAMRHVVELARQFAKSDVPILLVGPTGTGKELIAQHIHDWSGRRGALVDVNCGALPRDLVESVLFGRKKGAFSGATESSAGLVEAADGGTLFLDEINSLPIEAQVKLLRVLDSSQVRRVGETSNRSVDFRLIAASQDRLGQRVEEGAFRLDLLERIGGVVIELAPLSERLGDIVPLARVFAAEHATRLAATAEPALVGYSWPGNVRELRHVIGRAAVLCREGLIEAGTIAEALALGPTEQSRGPQTQQFDERAMLLAACEAGGWNAGDIAGDLGIGRTTLYRRLRDFGISLRQRKRLFRLSATRRHEET